VASLVGIFSMLNFWIYVHARIAMLDMFMVTFLLLAFYYFLKYKLEVKSKINFYLSSLFWGLAVAIKWSAVFIYLPFFIILLIENHTKENLIDLFLFGLFSVYIYFVTFFPYMLVSGNFKMSFSQIFLSTPFVMLKLQESVPANHPYQSAWYTWPFMIRPIWFEFIRDPNSPFFKGVVLLGNPMQMLMGLVSVLGLAITFKKINGIAKSALILFLFSWLVWAIAPRKLSFFYYFFPSAIFYSFLIPMFLKVMLADKKFKISLGIITFLSLILFIYFFPIISGEEALEATRTKWHWLQSWI
jgi:dolichyl-phosphate-mannose--protein O-mannosyl transferase